MNVTMTLLTGGGLLALGGFAVALLEARRDKSRYRHEKELAREARRQDRLEQAYLELGTYLARHEDWARSVRPFRGRVSAPDPMPPGERWRIQTLVTNYGSPEVQRLLERWTELARKIENADEVIGLADQARGPAPELEQEARRERLALEDYRKAMDEATDDIRAEMHAELAGDPAPEAGRLAGPPSLE
jgi:hypothetical protein